MDEPDKKKLQAEALGKLIYEQYYSSPTEGGLDVPKVSSEGMSFSYPTGLNSKEKDAFDSYIKKLREDSAKANQGMH